MIEEFSIYVFARHVRDNVWHRIAGFRLTADAIVFKTASIDRDYEYYIGENPPE